MRGQPSPAQLAERLARLARGLADIEQRKMFGYPALFLNGNMLAGLFSKSVVLRLPEEERHALAASGHAGPFVAMGGRVMREWVAVEDPERISDDLLGRWLEAALRHTAAMPPKAKKAARSRSKDSQC